jgi:hypothetical protein
MSWKILVSATMAVVAAATLPAEAAWKQYFNKDAVFSFNAPEGVKAAKTAYRSATAGQRPATAFEVTDDDVIFRVTVVDFSGRRNDDAAIIKEASAVLTSSGKVLSDADARVESSYGRKMTVELPNNGGRTMSGVYFNKDHLIELQVTVLPANGDYGSPDLGRFVDSLAFGDDRIGSDAIEVKVVK